MCSDDRVLFCIVQYANVANVTEVLSFKFYLIIINFEKIMSSGPITSWKIDGETVSDFIFWAPKSLQMVTAAMKLKDAYSLEEKLWPT